MGVENIFKCLQCSYNTNIKTNLIRHIHSMHSKNTNCFNCPICAQSFTRRDTLTRHRHTQHSAENRFQCPNCKVNFKTEGLLCRHDRTNSCKAKNYPTEEPKDSSQTITKSPIKMDRTHHLKTHIIDNKDRNVMEVETFLKQSKDEIINLIETIFKAQNSIKIDVELLCIYRRELDDGIRKSLNRFKSEEQAVNYLDFIPESYENCVEEICKLTKEYGVNEINWKLHSIKYIEIHIRKTILKRCLDDDDDNRVPQMVAKMSKTDTSSKVKLENFDSNDVIVIPSDDEDEIDVKPEIKEDYEARYREVTARLNGIQCFYNDKEVYWEDRLKNEEAFNKKLKEENTALQHDNDIINIIVEGIKTENKDLIQDNVRLKTENTSLQNENEALKPLRIENENLVQDSERLKTENTSLQIENDELKRLRIELTAQNILLENEKEGLKPLRIENENLVQDSERLKAENILLENENEGLKPLRIENEHLAQDNDNLNKLTESLQTELTALNSLKNDMAKENESLLETNSKLMDTIGSLNVEKAVSQHYNNELEERVQSMNDTVTNLEFEKKEYLNSTSESHLAAESNLKRMHEMNEDLRKQLQQQLADEETTKTIQTLRFEVKDLKSRLMEKLQIFTESPNEIDCKIDEKENPFIPNAMTDLVNFTNESYRTQMQLPENSHYFGENPFNQLYTTAMNRAKELTSEKTTLENMIKQQKLHLDAMFQSQKHANKEVIKLRSIIEHQDGVIKNLKKDILHQHKSYIDKLHYEPTHGVARQTQQHQPHQQPQQLHRPPQQQMPYKQNGYGMYHQ